MVRAASLPGSGGSPLQTPQMANLVGTKSVSTAPAEGATAGSTAAGGVAPVAAGSGICMAPMMGQRGDSGGTRSSLAVPAPLGHDLDEGDYDDDW